MPELPDVEKYRKEAEKCTNSGIEQVNVSDAHFVKLSENELDKKLKGKQFKKIIRHGKYLFLPADKSTSLVLHFGMTGEVHYLKEDEDKPKYTRCSILFKNKHTLHIVSRRKLGSVELAKDPDSFIKEKDLGPDALDIARKDFISLFENKKSMVKTALTDQSEIAGIGNVYADEILYQAKIHPQKPANQLSDKEKNTVYNELQNVLKTAIKHDADVSKLPESFLLPNRSQGKACPGCNGKIEKTKISGRTTYYCPSCQKSPK